MNNDFGIFILLPTVVVDVEFTIYFSFVLC